MEYAKQRMSMRLGNARYSCMSGSWIRPNRHSQALAAGHALAGLDDLLWESRKVSVRHRVGCRVVCSTPSLDHVVALSVGVPAADRLQAEPISAESFHPAVRKVGPVRAGLFVGGRRGLTDGPPGGSPRCRLMPVSSACG